MKLSFTKKFTEKYHSLTKEIQRKIDKQLKFLLQNWQHPSLRTKKYDEETGMWQARVDRYYRFYFLIKGDTYILLDIKSHPK